MTLKERLAELKYQLEHYDKLRLMGHKGLQKKHELPGMIARLEAKIAKMKKGGTRRRHGTRSTRSTRALTARRH